MYLEFSELGLILADSWVANSFLIDLEIERLDEIFDLADAVLVLGDGYPPLLNSSLLHAFYGIVESRELTL